MKWHLFPSQTFEQHKTAWDNLNSNGPKSPVLESRFIAPLLKYFGTGHESIAIYGETTNPEAMAILQRGSKGSWETFQPSQSPLGAWLHKTSLDQTELVNSLLDELPGFNLNIGLTQQDPDIYARPDNKQNIQTLDYIQTGRISINLSFDDYWAARGKNLRQNLRRQRNKLKREETETKLETITDPNQIKQAISEYGELESKGWKSDEGTAVHLDNNQGKFYLELLQDYCSTGHGCIYKYWYNNTLVALDLCISGFGTIVIMKTTYDESQKTNSPALLMRQDSFVDIFNDKSLKTIEFYGKVMDWHTKWTDEIRTMYHCNYYKWSIIASIKRLVS